ncbi:reverse transcriptase domain-containing protein, partial [Klebsiella pneumoniae]|uniref:reverse transcriptase domain-containing protein n=1 Tax=Klebsiella pneumoniae TaxID=573 RepID=UPI00117B1E4C
NEYLVSFDVESLYPNVPMKHVTNCIKVWLISRNIDEDTVQEYLLLINLCMSQNSFKFNDIFYKQVEGTAMGNPLSCFIANVFLRYFEIQAKQTLQYFPRVWIRYVDDVFAVFSHNEDLQHFVTLLN